MLGRIEVAAPFDFELSLRALGTPENWHGREYRRVVAWEGAAALLRLKSCGVIERPAVEWRLEGGAASTPESIAARLRRWLSHDVDLAACYTAFGGDPRLAALGERFYGLRIVRAASLYEGLLQATLQRQLDASVADSARHQFFRTYGPEVTFSGQAYHGCPCPEALRELPLSVSHAQALMSVARAASIGKLDDLAFDALSTEAAYERLMKLPGVGRWSAEFALWRGLGRPDALPASNLGLRRVITRLYRLATPLTAPALERRWRPLAAWRGYAAYYVWLSQQS